MRSLMICIIIRFSMSTFTVAQNLDFMQWDTNRDGVLKLIEFRNGFTARYFADWDNNDDSYLDDEDFYMATFLILDEDNDNLLSPQEWKFGYDYYFYDFMSEDFTYYDLDDDNFLTYQEYFPVIADTDYFVAFDADQNSYISEYELANYLFNIWDFDDSGTLSETEFELFNAHYKDI